MIVARIRLVNGVLWAGTVGNAEKLPARQLEKDKISIAG